MFKRSFLKACMHMGKVSPIVPSKSKATNLIMIAWNIDFPNYFTWISYGKTIGWNGFRDNASCPDNASLLNSNIR